MNAPQANTKITRCGHPAASGVMPAGRRNAFGLDQPITASATAWGAKGEAPRMLEKINLDHFEKQENLHQLVAE